jgi:anti-sigma B factor antagonist
LTFFTTASAVLCQTEKDGPIVRGKHAECGASPGRRSGESEIVKLEDSKCGNALVIKLIGDRLDAAAAPDFKETVTSRIDAGESTILLDLSSVNFIDSSGLGAMVAVLKRMSPSGKLVLCGLHDAAFSMFRLTRMDRVFPIFPSQAEALNALEA